MNDVWSHMVEEKHHQPLLAISNACEGMAQMKHAPNFIRKTHTQARVSSHPSSSNPLKRTYEPSPALLHSFIRNESAPTTFMTQPRQFKVLTSSRSSRIESIRCITWVWDTGSGARLSFRLWNPEDCLCRESDPLPPVVSATERLFKLKSMQPEYTRPKENIKVSVAAGPHKRISFGSNGWRVIAQLSYEPLDSGSVTNNTNATITTMLLTAPVLMAPKARRLSMAPERLVIQFSKSLNRRLQDSHLSSASTLYLCFILKS